MLRLLFGLAFLFQSSVFFILTCAYILSDSQIRLCQYKRTVKQRQFEKGSDINHVDEKAAIHKLIAQKICTYTIFLLSCVKTLSLRYHLENLLYDVRICTKLSKFTPYQVLNESNVDKTINI